MNKGLVFVLLRNLYAVVLIVALVALGLYVFYGEELYANTKFLLGDRDLSIILLYGTSAVFILLGMILTIRFESYIKQKELGEQLHKYNLLNDEMDFYGNEIPQKIMNSTFCVKIKERCDSAWNRGDYKEYLFLTQTYSEVLSYAYRMKDEDGVVSWREELDCMNKMILLLRNCCDETQAHIDLFEMSANYRFPIGLFVVPLFNAIENSINIEEGFLKIECFNIGGYWNCIIGSEHAHLRISDDDRRYIGFNALQKRVDLGNWPIDLGVKKHEQGIEMSISGKYAV